MNSKMQKRYRFFSVEMMIFSRRRQDDEKEISQDEISILVEILTGSTFCEGQVLPVRIKTSTISFQRSFPSFLSHYETYRRFISHKTGGQL